MNLIFDGTVLLSKANTLLFLKERITKSKILDIYCFTVDDFLTNQGLVYSNISSKFDTQVIVRSSAHIEDGNLSYAGHFKSVPNVEVSNKEDVINAVLAVIDSYNRENLNGKEQVFVQEQLKNIQLSGVAFTRNPKNDAPYYVINYDSNGDSESVTSGKCKETVYISRDIDIEVLKDEYLPFRHLIIAIKEIEAICNSDRIDIEFAITDDKSVVILQVRNLYCRLNQICNDSEFFHYKNRIIDEIIDKDIYSDMAFWNPSEMIGENPHPLDYSLYKSLITDKTWSVGLYDLGYNYVEDDLMVRFGNKPYIVLNRAFKGLTFRNIDLSIQEKLISHYCRQVNKYPEKHDNIEFEVCFSIYDISTIDRIRESIGQDLSDVETNKLVETLKSNTTRILDEYYHWLKKDLSSVETLEAVYKDNLKHLDCLDIREIVDSIDVLITNIREKGIIQFARQARYAFITKQLCVAYVKYGVVSDEEYEDYLKSIETIPHDLLEDMRLMSQGGLTLKEFEDKYGHLRNGTYDITARHFSDIKDYFANEEFKSVQHSFPKTLEHVESFLKKIELENPGYDLVKLLEVSTKYREYFKFCFTKPLSLVLELIKVLGIILGFTTEEMSYLTIEDILAIKQNQDCIKEYLYSQIQNSKEIFLVNGLIMLPSLIRTKRDVSVVHLGEKHPCFVTQECIEAPVICIDSQDAFDKDLNGKIVVIEQADPGYDWIFALYSISGLVTKYGGIGSHMAVRCSEFNIPAAIGCGTIVYEYIASSKKIRLDSGNEKLERLE